MNSLLPLFVIPQNGSNTIGGNGSDVGSAAQDRNNQSASFGPTFETAFSQARQDQQGASTVFNREESLIPVVSQERIETQLALPEGDLESLPIFPHVDVVETRASDERGKRIPTLQEESVFQNTDALAVRALPAGVPDIFTTGTSETSSTPASLSGPLATTRLFASQGTPVSDNTFGKTNFTQPTDGALAAGQVPQGRVSGSGENSLARGNSLQTTLSHSQSIQEIEGLVSRNRQGSNLGVLPQQVSSTSEIKTLSSRVNEEESVGPRTLASSVQDPANRVSQNGRRGQDVEVSTFAKNQALANSPNGSQGVLPNDVLPVTAAKVTGPGGAIQHSVTNGVAAKSISDISTRLNSVSNVIRHNRPTVQGDRLSEATVLGKGDRATNGETLIKSVELDSSGGHSLGNGANHSSQSQARFQELSTVPAQGVGVRGLERGPEFQTPTLQRLQLDVQLSENQRVAIDVGVQNRQVSAGLVMDHSVLRNLATQFVPQLESQLNQVDLKLQEFSAEVREERRQEEGSVFDGTQSHRHTPSPRHSSQHESEKEEHGVAQGTERGLHFVA